MTVDETEFKWPPKEIREIEETLSEADNRYKENKVYLFGREAAHSVTGD